MPGRGEGRLFARVAAAFVAPAPGAVEVSGGGPGVGVAPSPPRVAVLCRPEDAPALGGAVALGMRRGGGPGVACVWRDASADVGPRAAAPAVPRALRLAERLGERGHVTHATGRLVVIALDEAADGGAAAAAAAEAVRVGAACPDASVVSVLAGARDDSLDRLLLAQDRVLVARSPDDPPALLELALDGLGGLGARAEVLAVPAAAGPARALAAAGVALLPPLRSAVDAALEGVG